MRLLLILVTAAFCMASNQSFAETLYQKADKLYYAAKSKIHPKDLPLIMDKSNSYKCVFLVKDEPNKPLHRPAMFGRYEIGTENDDPVLGPKKYSFVAGPMLWTNYLKRGAYIFPKVKSTIENNGEVLHTKFYDSYRKKSSWQDYRETWTHHLFVRKNEDEIYMIKASRRYTKKGQSTYSTADGESEYTEYYNKNILTRVIGYCWDNKN